MIGVFDSGVGGLCSYNELRMLLPREDIVYLADKSNAPYGTKTKEELIRLVRADIKRLREYGAEKILVACCTASTVFPFLPESKDGRIVTMIEPTADYVAELEKDEDKPIRISVIATEHTVTSKAFSGEIKKRLPKALVKEISAQRLVGLVEEGSSDGRLSECAARYLDRLAKTVRADNPEYLILGCTHFSHVEEELKKRLGEVKTVNPARLGAIKLSKLIKTEKEAGSGKSLYTE